MVEPIELELGFRLIKLADPDAGGDLMDRVSQLRNRIAQDLGILLPKVKIRDSLRLKDFGYRIKFRGVTVATGELRMDALLAINPGFVSGELAGQDHSEPATGRPAKWIDSTLAEQAKFMLETFNKAVAGKYAAAAAKVADEPAEAWSAVDATAKWAPQSPESAKARADMSKWMRDPANLKELAADKLWLGLKTQAAKIDFEKHPEAKPTNQMESDLRKLIKEHPQSKALAKARQTAAGWKLDPETGRTEPSKAASKSAAKPAALGASAK